MNSAKAANRPRWGVLDVGLGVLYVAATTLVAVGVALGLDAAGVVGDSDDDVLLLGLISWAGLQIGLGTWPVLVSRWKGRGVASDWRLRFKPIDPLLGVGTAIIAVGLGAVAATLVANVVGLAPEEVEGNTQPITEAEGSIWLYALVVFVVVVAPLSEELFFRGLTLRAVEKRLGTVAAVVLSTLLFTVTHYTGGDLDQTAVLAAAIAGAGLVFAIVALQTDRLWPSIFGHMAFNGLAASRALGLFGPETGS
ncbi:MAG: CPBP family intramembrane glutamic endopeptidase [Actinomycetota bacterium]